MKTFRHAVAGLLVLLQFLTPYLHAHRVQDGATGLHVHLSALASAAPSACAPAAERVGPAAFADDSRALALRPSAHPAAQASSLVPQADMAAIGMPTEWLRDQPLHVPEPARLEAAPRAPPAAAVAVVSVPSPAGAQPRAAPQRFAVLAYAAVAPPSSAPI